MSDQEPKAGGTAETEICTFCPEHFEVASVCDWMRGPQTERMPVMAHATG